MNTTVSYQTTFECGYISQELHSDKHFELNAHRYQLSVTVSTRSYRSDMRVMDFDALKYMVDSLVPDKQWLYSSEDLDDPLRKGVVESFNSLDIPTMICPFVLSCEGLASYLARNIQDYLNSVNPNIEVRQLVLRENNQVYSTVSRS